ncbi:MAG: hypothetical protein GSR86_01335 [Desulfurococcales archaeon]|nr:hypothetical protein [Desulfurococcales archaeon]
MERIAWIRNYLSSSPSIIGVYASLLAFRAEYVYALRRGGHSVDRETLVNEVLDRLKLTIPKFTGRVIESLEAARQFTEDLVSELGSTDSLEEAKLMLEEIEVEYINDFNKPLEKYGLRLVRSLDEDEARSILKILEAIEKRIIVREMTAAGSAIVYIQGLSIGVSETGRMDTVRFEEMFSYMILVLTGENAVIPAYFLSKEFKGLLESKSKGL